MSTAAKIVLITGASKGIGLELALRYAASQFTVVATCRKASAAMRGSVLAAPPHSIVEGVEVDTDAGIDALKRAVLGVPEIHLLINNAGILTEETCDDCATEEGLERIRKQFEVNTLGPLRVTAALKDKLQQNGGKVAIITSRMGSIADNGSGGFLGYRVSKAAVNMAAKNLSLSLAPKGIVVCLLHPGMVATDMTARFGGGISTAESVTGLMKQIEAASPKTSGIFFHQDGTELPW